MHIDDGLERRAIRSDTVSGRSRGPVTPFEVSADGATSTAVAHAVKEIDEGMHLQPMPETTVSPAG